MESTAARNVKMPHGNMGIQNQETGTTVAHSATTVQFVTKATI